MRRIVLVVLLASLLPPGARAEGVRGDLAFPEGLDLEGDVEVAAGRGVLDLFGAVKAGEPLSLRFASAEGYVVTTTHRHVGAGDLFSPVLPEEAPRENVSFSLPAGVVENFTCGPECRAIVFAAEDGVSQVFLAGTAGGPVGAATEARVYAKGAADKPDEDAFLYRVDAGWVLAAARPAAHQPRLLLADATAGVKGDVLLFLADADADWRAGNDSGRLRTTATNRSVEGPGGVPLPASRDQERPFLVLRMRDATLVAPPGADVVLATPVPSLSVTGALRSARATGAFLVDGARVPVRGEALEVEGAFRLDGRVSPPGALVLHPGAPDLDATLSGDVSRLAVGGRAVPLGAPLPVSPSTALVAGLSLAGLLAALVLLKVAGIPFYMRVTHASLLRNANRRAIYEAIQRRPGITVAELTRTTGLTEIVVRHHARMLEAHRYVAVRMAGKMRAHFALDSRTSPQAMGVGVVLKDETRRRIAEALAGARRPLTQGDLAEAAGVSRRLVSYHLTRLESSGLVEQDGRTPAGYAPTSVLVEFLGERPGRAASAE